MHLSPHGQGSACHHTSDSLPLNRSFAIAVVLNVLLVVGEAIGGWMAGSMALLADAGHNLSDVAGLLMAWWAHWLRGRSAGGRWTYGWRSFTILAAHLNGVLLVVAIMGVSLESIRRLFEPSQVAELPVLYVASLATLLNFATARLLASATHDLNVRGAYLHMLADAAVSLAVVVGAVVMMFTNWQWLDPAISLSICCVLVLGTWRLLRDSTGMLMHAAPRDLELDDLRDYFVTHAPIAEVEDLHVWSVSTTDVVLTVRLLCPLLEAREQDALRNRLHEGLREEFGIGHATIEIARSGPSSGVCALDALR